MHADSWEKNWISLIRKNFSRIIRAWFSYGIIVWSWLFASSVVKCWRSSYIFGTFKNKQQKKIIIIVKMNILLSCTIAFSFLSYNRKWQFSTCWKYITILRDCACVLRTINSLVINVHKFTKTEEYLVLFTRVNQ